MQGRILSGDIGGTNARLALLKGLEIEALKIYPTRGFTDFIQILEQFSKDIDRPLPGRMVFAVAGVVEQERVAGTNLPWDIEKQQLVDRFNLERCLLLNDFEAAASGLLVIDKEKLLPLDKGRTRDALGPMALLGPGTGLGEAIMIRCPRGSWKAVRGEGGHASFSPTSQEEIQLLTFLLDRYSHVSFERVLSGQGLVEIYQFITRAIGEKQGDRDETGELDPAQITSLAKAGDPSALKAVRLFCRIYGSEAGNLALKILATGGVYLWGGVTMHILPMILEGEFMTGFEAKGRMGRILKDIPVFIVQEPYMAIFGGAYRLLEEN